MNNRGAKSDIPAADDVLKAVSETWGVSREVLTKSQASRKYSTYEFEARRAAIYLLRKDLGMLLVPIARIIGLSQDYQVSGHVKRIEEELTIDRGLRGRVVAARALYTLKASA